MPSVVECLVGVHCTVLDNGVAPLGEGGKGGCGECRVGVPVWTGLMSTGASSGGVLMKGC